MSSTTLNLAYLLTQCCCGSCR